MQLVDSSDPEVDASAYTVCGELTDTPNGTYYDETINCGGQRAGFVILTASSPTTTSRIVIYSIKVYTILGNRFESKTFNLWLFYLLKF